MPRVGGQDAFEFSYRNKLKGLLSRHGLLIEYDEDRAALDLGLHPYKPEAAIGRELSDARVWFPRRFSVAQIAATTTHEAASASSVATPVTVDVGNAPSNLALGPNALWVAVRA